MASATNKAGIECSGSTRVRHARKEVGTGAARAEPDRGCGEFGAVVGRRMRQVHHAEPWWVRRLERPTRRGPGTRQAQCSVFRGRRPIASCSMKDAGVPWSACWTSMAAAPLRSSPTRHRQAKQPRDWVRGWAHRLRSAYQQPGSPRGMRKRGGTRTKLITSPRILLLDSSQARSTYRPWAIMSDELSHWGVLTKPAVVLSRTISTEAIALADKVLCLHRRTSHRLRRLRRDNCATPHVQEVRSNRLCHALPRIGSRCDAVDSRTRTHERET